MDGSGAVGLEAVLGVSSKRAVDRGDTVKRRLTRRDLIGGTLALATAPFLGALIAPAPSGLAARGWWRSRQLDALRPRVAEDVTCVPDADGVQVTTPQGAHLVLNETAQEILGLCDGRRSSGEIARSLADRYRGDASSARILPQVADTLTLLLRAGVLRA